jgi:HPt (histidine-containing phosphotransfer) domain-containing protein
MDPIEQKALNEAIDRMWTQFMPQTQERLAALEIAAAAFAAGHLTAEQHEAANTAAHKLAGVLGTFGLTKGTVLARELEIMYTRENGPDPAMSARLAEIAAQLRTIVENRK